MPIDDATPYYAHERRTFGQPRYRGTTARSGRTLTPYTKAWEKARRKVVERALSRGR